ncbi:MAG: hypothetical protein A3F68_01275 [Acidobacteria bacterium RIFCSPLOWO2_12_FULL_54_10]|nr:MAG: hypothetical protein A3F68_01275 [Acidobacteria bacterium RIFCSPLOWO2_12_FULL_54_10]
MAKILLVEDHPALVALRKKVLQQYGHKVSCAKDALHACRLLKSRHYDLVITDKILSKGTGIEVAQLAHELRIPVVLSSGWPAGKATHLFTHILPKPCTLRKFLGVIHATLESSGI